MGVWLKSDLSFIKLMVKSIKCTGHTQPKDTIHTFTVVHSNSHAHLLFLICVSRLRAAQKDHHVRKTNLTNKTDLFEALNCFQYGLRLESLVSSAIMYK